MKSYRVSDVFTRAVFTLKPEESLEAARLAMERLSVRHIPIVDHDHRLVGIISDRDLLLYTVPSHGDRPRVTETIISDVMKRQPVCCRTTDTIHDAVDLLISHRINCLPIKDHRGVLVGLITTTDILRLVRDHTYGMPETMQLNFIDQLNSTYEFR